MAKETKKDDLERLLDWYQKFKPTVKTVHVRMQPKDLSFADKTKNPLQFLYRGFVLERIEDRKAS